MQDRQIETRINKLFFAEVVNRIQSKKDLKPHEMMNLHNLPLNIRAKDKIINSLLYKYKEYDLLVEPDLKEIYHEIDMTLKKIAVKVVPNYLENETENNNSITGNGLSPKMPCCGGSWMSRKSSIRSTTMRMMSTR